MKELNQGVGLVAVNPSENVGDAPGLSVIRSTRIPLRSRSMRGVALGERYGSDPYWIGEAARVVLPGLRLVGVGTPDAAGEEVDLLASAGGVWVGTPGSPLARRDQAERGRG
jgi:hypothetical protein